MQMNPCYLGACPLHNLARDSMPRRERALKGEFGEESKREREIHSPPSPPPQFPPIGNNFTYDYGDHTISNEENSLSSIFTWIIQCFKCPQISGICGPVPI